MSSQAYHYDAFISYRHTDRDKKIVDVIQKLTENYLSPCNGAYIKKGQRIRRVFTDRSELPMSADLGESLRRAVEQSRFFLIIASPEYMESKWCIEELKTFLACNHHSTERILFIRVGGEPSCVTDILRAAGVRVDDDSFKEPLYIEACAPTTRGSVSIVRKEHLRLAAILIGCGYDQLYQRHRRARQRKILSVAATALLLTAIVGMLLFSEVMRRKREESYRDMDASISAIYSLLQSEDAAEALDSMRMLYSRYAQNTEYADYIAQQLEPAVLQASYIPAFSAFASEPLPAQQSDISVSSDGKYVLAFDIGSMRETGNMRVFLYDAYLKKISEHVLPVGEWKDDLLSGYVFSNALQLDYHEAEHAFEIKLLAGERRLFSADGQLLSAQTLTANEAIPADSAILDMYQELTAAARPACMGENGVYTLATTEEAGFEVFGEKDAPYWLVHIPASGDSVRVTAVLARTSDMHAIEDITITPDNRYVLVREAQGVYNDVVTICDTEGRFSGVRIDLDDHTLQSMQYQFDDEKQKARFLFNLCVAGGNDESVLAECVIASGELLGCDMYKGRYVYTMLQSAQGYVYIMDNSEIKAIATQNICLPERMTGISSEVLVRLDVAQNDLVEHAEAFSLNSTGDMKSTPAGSLTITPEISRPHHSTPASYSGVDTGIAIIDGTGSEAVRFFSRDSSGFQHPYFNAQDSVFGLIDYRFPDNTEAFRLYDFAGLMDVLR